MSLKIPKRLKLHPSMQRSKDQEEELALRVGGRKTLASGALDVKGDVRKKGVVRIEAKTTSHKSFSVTLDMLKKIEDAAFSANELPAIVVEFIDQKGKPKSSVAVVPTYVLEMIGAWKEEQ